jgi:hypothetical protein
MGGVSMSHCMPEEFRSRELTQVRALVIEHRVLFEAKC